jgi:hypothetical protein
MHKVYVGDQNKLNNDFLKEEPFAALNSIHNGKSPGLDGLPSKFYKVMWDIVGDDLLFGN